MKKKLNKYKNLKKNSAKNLNKNNKEKEQNSADENTLNSKFSQNTTIYPSDIQGLFDRLGIE